MTARCVPELLKSTTKRRPCLHCLVRSQMASGMVCHDPTIGFMSTGPLGRVRRWPCGHPLPSEPYVPVSRHTAQASTTAPSERRGRQRRIVGFTIRDGGQRTSVGGCTRVQKTPSSAFPPLLLESISLVTGDFAEVSSLSRRARGPVSRRLQAGIGFLRDPIPALPWARLAACFPRREEYGLTKFRACTQMV